MNSLALRTQHPLVAAPAVLAAAFVGIAATLDTEDGTTFCFFRICTGGYCPGCGGSRAAAALLKADLSGAWAIHPWVPLIVAQLLIALGATLAWGRDRVRGALVPVLIFNTVLGVSIWVARLATQAIPAPW